MSQLLLAPHERPSIARGGTPHKQARKPMPQNDGTSAPRKVLLSELAKCATIADKWGVVNKFIPITVILDERSCVGVLINAFAPGTDRDNVVQKLHQLAIGQNKTRLAEKIRTIAANQAARIGKPTLEIIVRTGKAR